MVVRSILFTLLLSLCAAVGIHAQEDSTGTDNANWNHHRFRFHEWRFEFKGRPTISLNYGFSKMERKDYTESFAKPGMIDLKLGYTRNSSTWAEDKIMDYGFRYIYLSNFSQNLSGGQASAQEIKADLWRFGFGRASGYGYKIGNAAIIPYHSYNFGWSKLQMKDTPLNPADAEITDMYNGSFRFGTGFEGGISFRIIPQMSIDAGYERDVIFPRWLFWKWLGSVAVETAGQIAIDNFVDEVLDSSPYAAPIVNFILKNGLAYGIYQLRHDKMNWPVNTVPPLAYDQFKLGLTFIF